MKRAGYSLIELLVYIGILAVLLSVGFVAVERCMENSWAFRHNVDELSRAMHAGELWRADVRAASGRVRYEARGDTQVLHIPTGRGEITYRMETNSVQRHLGSGPWTTVLDDVKTSAMQPDARQTVNAWRWEVELVRPDHGPARGPLLSFVAVPGSNSKR